MAGNPYTVKLAEVAEAVPQAQRGLGLSDGPGLKSRWREYFSERMGSGPVGAPHHLFVEIGSSQGLFLNAMAQQNPVDGWIGIEWKVKAVYRAASRAIKDQIKNVAYVREDARHLGDLFAEGEIDELLVLFPDPWAKARQRKKRLLNEGFLREVARLLRPGTGRVLFKTDHPGYFQWVCALFGVKQLKLPAYDGFSDENAGRAHQTHVKLNKRARQVRVRQIESVEDLPAESKELQRLFVVAGGQERVGRELPPTEFEKRFTAENLPIYQLELVRAPI